MRAVWALPAFFSLLMIARGLEGSLNLSRLSATLYWATFRATLLAISLETSPSQEWTSDIEPQCHVIRTCILSPCTLSLHTCSVWINVKSRVVESVTVSQCTIITIYLEAETTNTCIFVTGDSDVLFPLWTLHPQQLVVLKINLRGFSSDACAFYHDHNPILLHDDNPWFLDQL